MVCTLTSLIDITAYKAEGGKMANEIPTTIKHLNTLLGEQLIGDGGGSGSTAIVTFKNSADATSYIVTVVMADNTSGVSISNVQIATAEGDGFTVPLYNGKMTLPLEYFDGVDQTVTPTLTGAVTLDMENFNFVITGDCSISLAGRQ